MTFDAWLTLHVFRRVVRIRTAGAQPQRIPILMYHSVSPVPSPHVHPYFQTNVTPGRFREHVRWLADHGYETLTMTAAVAALSATERTDRPRVAITFDDGYADFAENAWPILQSAGMTATMFLPTAYIGDSAAQRRTMENRPCLIWDEARTFAKAGVEFGSHTVTHPQLADETPEQMIVELENSKQTLDSHLDRPCAGFSYPFAFPSANRDVRQRLRSGLEQAGYTWGVTTMIGTAKTGGDRYAMPRLPVNEHDTPDLLEAKLHGAYDWLGHAQHTVKRLRNLL